MADFAPNFTARYRLKYTVLGRNHTMTWRVASDTETVTGVASKMGLFLDDMADVLYASFTITGADFAPADSDIFLPVTAPTFAGGGGSEGSAAATDRDIALSFVGRSTGGNKGRFFLYGTTFGLAVRTGTVADWKLTSAEYPDSISDAIVRLNETSPALVANDDNPMVWYEYANIKYNDRWLRHDRRG